MVAGSFPDWLRSRDDRQLARLLRLRPDLALPAPADVAALAGRAAVRTSTQRAVDALDARTLSALEALVLAADADETVQHPAADGLAELFEHALVWGDAEQVHLVPTVRDSVGPYPAGLGRPAAVLFRDRSGPGAVQDPDRLAELIAGLPEDEREILDRLAGGPPVGTVRTTRGPFSDADDSPVQRLLGRGLVAVLDAQRVELPREVGLVVRREANRPRRSDPPEIRLVTRQPAELDRLGTTAVLELLRLIDALAGSWTANPPPLLRAGGIGVRELRRTARELDVDEATTALLAEVGYAAGLLNSTNGPEPVYLPSSEYDVWRGRETAQRWRPIATAWLAMTRQPSLVSQRGDRDRVISALGPDAERGTIPALRRQVLDLLVGLPPGAAPADRADVLAVLAWQQPRRAAARRPLADAILAEGDVLGLTAAGGMTGYTRTLLAGSAAAAETALEHALPTPVDHFLVQPDLTVVVPGPPHRTLGAELALLADVESTGGAHVYRITERSVRRALDAGRSGAQLVAFVEATSRTPVPQALRYLIEDAARRHGVLRAGAASAYLRCADEALLARVLADRGTANINLHRLAPTVAITDAPVNRLLEALRAAGYSPAAEGPSGEVITIGAEPPRAPSRPAARPLVTRGATDSDAQLAELVRRMRSGDELAAAGRRAAPLAGQIPGVTTAATMELLRRAVREEQLLWLGIADPDGVASAHEIYPISLAAGYVRGYERGGERLVAYPVHRITAVRVLEDDD